ncbi:MAG: ribonuclease Y [Planctomycetota bacterium]
MTTSTWLIAEISGGLAGLIGVGGLLVGAGLGVLLSRALGARTLSAAKAEAQTLLDRAKKDAETEAQKIKLDAEQAALERKERLDKEAEAARSEIRETERRLAKREDAFQRREETLGRKEEDNTRKAEKLQDKLDRATQRQEELDELAEERKTKLLHVAEMSKEEATGEVLRLLEEESRHDAAKIARRVIEKAEEEAKDKAREVTLQAIQRFATETTSESTVRSVAIPSDDMKGRIIGREGRNIRALEKATGVDVIVDDTPGVIVISCFDKVRQAIAVEALERLIADGRLHPTRIEEVVERVRKEIGEQVVKHGKEAVLEVGLRGVHGKVSEAMGKLHYRTSYGQNVLRHSIEVAYFCQIIAEQLGLDGKLAKRCGFLHDIGKAMDHEMEGGHPKIGMDFAKQFGEKDIVLNAIGGHHGDIPSTSFYTPIVMAADAVSSARPGARRESMERYVQRLNELQDIALGHQGVVEAHAIQAGREVRVMVDAARVGDDEAYLIAHDIAKRVSDEMTFPGEVRVTVLRETRAIDIAR